MKKILILCLIIAVGLGVSGATCLNNLQDNICNPPPAVISAVQAAAPVVAFIINQAREDSDEYITAVAVQGVVTSILAGACVSVTQLNNLIAWLDSNQGQAAVAESNLKAGPMKAKAINIQALRDWRNSML